MTQDFENPRMLILDGDIYQQLIYRLTAATEQWVGIDLRPRQAEMMVDAVLPLLRIMWPMESSYDASLCPWMLTTEDGWMQCEDDPGHRGHDHEGCDWGWGEGDPNAYRGDLKPKNQFADVVEERDLLRAQLDAVLALQKREFHAGGSLQDFQDTGYNEALRHVHQAIRAIEDKG